MDFVRIGSINLEDLEPSAREWLESLDNDLNDHFVEVSDGDASLVRDIERSLLSPDELLDSEYADACYVAASKEMSDEWIEKMDAKRVRANSFWSDEIYWRPVGE